MSPPQSAPHTASPQALDSKADSLEPRFRAVLVQVEQDPRNVAVMSAFAAQAHSEGAAELAVRAHFVVSAAHATMQRFQEAALAIDKGSGLAARAGSALRHEADFFRAVLLAEQGEHDQSSRLFMAIVSGQHFSELRPRVRMDCLRLLADQCVAARAVDAALDCWTLLENEALACMQGLPATFRLLKSAAYLDIHVDSDPAFSTMIEAGLGEPASEALRSTLLALAEAECHRAVDALDGEVLGARATMAQLLPRLLLVAKSGLSQDAADAADAFESAVRTNPSLDAEFRARVVAALVRVGQWHRADELLQQGPAAGVSQTPSLRLLRLQYFRSLVARAQGDAEAALALYGEYALQTTKAMRQMNLHLRGLMRAITERAGLRPRDRPGYVPRYLVQAQKLLSSGAQLMSVADAAREVGVSERTLREAFAVHESKTPKQFQIQARLDQAKALVESEAGATHTVEEIALATGFAHAGRFARMFRDRFGLSVGQCKENYGISKLGGNDAGSQP